MSRSQVFFFVLVGVMLLVCPMSWAGSGCFDSSVEVSFSGDPLSPYAPYTGELNGSIGSQPFEHVPATLIIGAPRLGDDGTLHTVNTVIATFENMGTLMLTERVVASPTDVPYVYRVNTRLDICDSDDPACTGYFENAFGRLSFHGYIDFSTARIAGSSKGRICWN